MNKLSHFPHPSSPNVSQQHELTNDILMANNSLELADEEVGGSIDGRDPDTEMDVGWEEIMDAQHTRSDGGCNGNIATY